MTEPRSSGPRITSAIQVPVGPTPAGADGNPLPMHPQLLEEALRNFVKAIRATQMYLPNNPIYLRAVDTTRAAFKPLSQKSSAACTANRGSICPPPSG